MDLVRVRVVPESPWLTPWQSDTLAGLLCWTAARLHGGEWLKREIIEPALRGEPRFVLSDAFPEDCLPLPLALRLADWPAESRKQVKRARWLRWDAFRSWQQGSEIQLEQMVASQGITSYSALRNCISRAENSTGTRGGLFPKEERFLDSGMAYLSVYARLAAGFRQEFLELLLDLARGGFGADVSVGKGQFRLDSDLENVTELDDTPDAGGCVALSTFQPSRNDPTGGYWEAFTKYGKLGPDFGLESVFKRPLVMLRPGACFRDPVPRGWMGRAVPMSELLAPEVGAELSARGVSIAHLAHGLTVSVSSARWP